MRGFPKSNKGVILRLYEKGVAPPDVARITDHSLEAVDRYIKDCERVKVLLGKGLSVTLANFLIFVQSVLWYNRSAGP